MCGFAGFFNTSAVSDREAVIHAMADRIVHRGPDDAHYYVDEDISLGFPVPLSYWLREEKEYLSLIHI